MLLMAQVFVIRAYLLNGNWSIHECGQGHESFVELEHLHDNAPLNPQQETTTCQTGLEHCTRLWEQMNVHRENHVIEMILTSRNLFMPAHKLIIP